MSTASPAALDEFLSRYTSQVGSGFGLIQGDVQAVFATLIIISLGLSGLLWALDENDNVPAALIRKILLIGFFAWLITGWHSLTQTVVNGFAALGLKAGGGAMSVGDLMHSPSKVVIDGLKVAFELLKYMGRLASEGMGVGFFTHFDAILVTGIAAIGIIAAFAVLGVHIAVTIIEFYIVTLIGFATVPFGILTQTAFLSERAIAYVVAVGVKVMAIAIVISIGEQIFTSYIVSAEPDWSESCGLLIAALVFCMLGFKIPSIAQAQIGGGPQLSAGSAAAGAVGLAATVGGLALAGRWAAGGMAAGAGAAAARGAAGLRGGLGASSGGGAAPSGGSASGGSPSGGGGGEAAPPGPKVADVVRKAKASFSGGPSPAAPPPPAQASSGHGSANQGADGSPSPPSRPKSRAGRSAAAARPWGEDDQGQPLGMPAIHPPSDDA